MIVATGLGVQFSFDRHLRVVTPGEAHLRGKGMTTWGVHDMSFTIRPGDGTALIGPSGSGKTTLLRVLAGIYAPDSGRLDVTGRVASLLSVEAGLLALLTGRENAVLLGVIAGLSRRTAIKGLARVKERSGLGDTFERPVLTYSQGMKARLGLAVAEEINPEILLLDEVHEALDHEFRGFLQSRAESLLDAGGIVVAAGHDHPMLARMCARALWLENGSIRAEGSFEEVRSSYVAAVEGEGADGGVVTG
jgi:ABC-type polysaccharide/polyol phosphate transport system ATPase subunit